MKKITLLSLSIIFLLGISSCKDEEEITLGSAPTEADAAFTYTPTAENANIIDFTALNSNLTAKWDFGNGLKGEGINVQGSYPNKGTYTVTLTVFNSGGSASSSQDITIDEDDLSLLSNPLFDLLTGGIDGPGSKVWVFDSTRAGHFGVGPNPSTENGDIPEHWSADPLIKANTGMYDDKYEFSLNGFQFDQITNGHVYVNLNDDGSSGAEVDFSDGYENAGDYTAYFDNQTATWSFTEDEDTTLTVTGSSFIGFYCGVRSYKVVKLEENEMILRAADAYDPTLAWYFRLVPEDFPVDDIGGGGELDTTGKFTLPMDFESKEPTWEVFGGNTFEYVDNPDISAGNASNRVLSTLKGDQGWGGIWVGLKYHLDFSSENNIAFKIWAPTTGDLIVKIENENIASQFIEKTVPVSTANEWVDVSADFTGTELNKYSKLVIIPSWDASNTGTFYIDDIEQK